jgi:predicted TPR repeat methyltransferase
MNTQEPNFLGMAMNAFGAGDMPAARHFLTEADRRDPNNPQILNGLCAVTFRLGDNEGALALIERVVKLVPGSWPFWAQYITILLACGRVADATEVSARAEAAGALDAALAGLRAARDGQPGDVVSARNVSLALLMCGRLEDSIEAYSASTAPLDEAAADNAADIVVRTQYAGLVEGYDTNSLHNAVVETMQELIRESFGDGGGARRLLDCGCGTGLLGQRLSDWAGQLVGIDLSAEMVERARSRGLYAALHVGDMTDEMNRLDAEFDAVVCNFAIYHMSDLTGFFDAAGTWLAAGGKLFLSCDPCTDKHDVRQTGPHEYAHSRAYLSRLAEASGLRAETLRIAAHRAYPGFWCVFAKP